MVCRAFFEFFGGVSEHSIVLLLVGRDDCHGSSETCSVASGETVLVAMSAPEQPRLGTRYTPDPVFCFHHFPALVWRFIIRVLSIGGVTSQWQKTQIPEIHISQNRTCGVIGLKAV